TGPAHVAGMVDQAIRVALGRRTVAHLTIPKDLQSQEASRGEQSTANIAGHSGHMLGENDPTPPMHELRRAAEVINSGSKIAILVGRGCLGARDEVLALADRVGGPIVKALLGKAVVPDDDPHTTGGIGLLGTSPSYEVMH